MFEARGVSKSYGSVEALSSVSVAINPGEVHAILGANGAGKSTLMKILAGAERPTIGGLVLEGSPIEFSDTREAARNGIAWVAQELMVYEQLDVLENLFLTTEPRIGPLVSRREMRRIARPYLAMVGLPENLSGPLGLLRLGERQRIEICRALMRSPRILILDEPTSALDAHETERLFEVIARLRASGVAIVLVSHFLEDVFQVADIITVLRDGHTIIAGEPASNVSQKDVIDAMLGERVPVVTRERSATSKALDASRALRLTAVGLDGVLSPTNLTVHAGEIVALAGLEGSGSTALMSILSGQIRADEGTVELPGGGGAPRTMADAAQNGIAFVPADRARVGIFAQQTVSENIASVRSLGMRSGRMFVSKSLNDSRAGARVAQLEIAPRRVDIAVGSLSGGNQQKVVFAKWLEANPHLYLLDDPTRGVDVHTRGQMHEVIRDLAAEGAVVLIASSDTDELCALADRALVFFHGSAVGEVPSSALTPHVLLEAINTGSVPVNH
ncbi:MAG: sugar ABC transporter ATP-binding protein [Microbacteriaceae bacterium]